jgi:hypothetical protein
MRDAITKKSSPLTFGCKGRFLFIKSKNFRSRTHCTTPLQQNGPTTFSSVFLGFCWFRGDGV